MKKRFISFYLGLLFTAFSVAQDNQYLEVDYEMELKLDADEVVKNIPAQQRAYVEDAIRTEIKNGIFIDYKLKTDGNQSIYKMQEKLDNTQNGAGFIMQQFTSQDKEPLYKEVVDRKFNKLYHIFGKKYLINDSLPNYEWTITREKDQIAGFEVKKANGFYVEGTRGDTIKITAWFAPKLKFKDGPDRVWGLPGLVLKTEADVKAQSVVAITIAKNVKVKEGQLKVKTPKEDKVYTQKEFDDEMIALREKWQQQAQGGVDTSE